LTTSVVAVAAILETAIVIAIVTVADAVETATTVKKPNQRSPQTMF
jgi:hypothetical protein